MASELVEIVDDKVRLHPHPGQLAALDSDKRFVFIISGSQGGKTSLVPWWLHREIERRGQGDYLAVTATFDLFKLKFLPEMQRVFCQLCASEQWQYAASDRVIWRKEIDRTLTRIILRSAEAEGGLESATAKAAVLDECGQDRFSLQAWEAVQRRLALNQGRVFGATTPYNMGWLKTEIFDRWRRGEPEYQVIQFESVMNPAFPGEEYERAKRTLPAWKFEMFYRGNFERPPGLIYGDLSQDQVIAPVELKAEWPRYVGIDPGPLHTAVVWIVEDPDKKIYYLYREYLSGERTTKQHVEAVKKLSEKENVIRWMLGQKSEKQYRWDWAAAGISAGEPNITEVEAGIDRVIELIKTKRLFIFNTCRGTIDQLGTYSREMDESGMVTEKIKDKEMFHFMDALRYDVIGFTSGRLNVY